MSAAFKLAKKKVSQQDLRRMFVEQKTLRNGENELVKKIDSPFAKYENGQLSCQLCKKSIKEAVWKVHINSSQHKNNLAHAKQLKEKLVEHVKPPPTIQQRVQQFKSDGNKLKSILKNSSLASADQEMTDEPEPPTLTANAPLPDDFFDSNKESVAKKPDKALKQEGDEKMLIDEAIPEGFFDDPKKDAKARHIEYKNPVEEEWDKFQKEIKEAESESLNIINEEQEESTAERQIDEIDAQMRNWTRVLELEKKKEKIVSRPKCDKPEKVEISEDEDDSEEELPELLDWRAKKVQK